MKPVRMWGDYIHNPNGFPIYLLYGCGLGGRQTESAIRCSTEAKRQMGPACHLLDWTLCKWATNVTSESSWLEGYDDGAHSSNERSAFAFRGLKEPGWLKSFLIRTQLGRLFFVSSILGICLRFSAARWRVINSFALGQWFPRGNLWWILCCFIFNSGFQY